MLLATRSSQSSVDPGKLKSYLTIRKYYIYNIPFIHPFQQAIYLLFIIFVSFSIQKYLL